MHYWHSVVFFGKQETRYNLSMFQPHQRQSLIHTHPQKASPTHEFADLCARHRRERRGHRKILSKSPAGNRSSSRQGYYPYCWGSQRQSGRWRRPASRRQNWIRRTE